MISGGVSEELLAAGGLVLDVPFRARPRRLCRGSRRRHDNNTSRVTERESIGGFRTPPLALTTTAPTASLAAVSMLEPLKKFWSRPSSLLRLHISPATNWSRRDCRACGLALALVWSI